MAINNINAQIGLLVNKSSVNAVVNNVTTIKEQVLSVGPVFAQFQKKIESLGDVAKWASVGVGAEKAFGGIKSIIDSVTVLTMFKKNPYKTKTGLIVDANDIEWHEQIRR